MNQTVMDERSPLLLFDVLGGLRTLWHRRVLIVVMTATLLAVGALYIVSTKPTYTAEAAILVDTRDARATTLDSVLPGIGADSAAISSQVSVIESRDLLGAVFDANGLANDPEFADPGLFAKLMSRFRPVAPLSRDAIFEKFQSLVGVQREGLTYIIDVSFKSRDAGKAARIVNAIVARYRASLADQAANADNSVSATLSDKIIGLQKDVGDAERAVQDFKSSHNIFDAGTGGSVQSQIDQLTTQLVAAQDSANQAQDRYNQAVAAGTGAKSLDKLTAIVPSPAADRLRDTYNARASALANAQALYGPKHPTIVSLEAELQKLNGLMGQEADRIVQELKASRDLSALNVKKLQASLVALRAEGNQSDLAQVQLRELQRQSDAARSVLDAFMKRAQETSQMQGLQLSQVRIISSAAPPTQATWPKPLLLLPVSALLGLAAGCALALALGTPKPVLAPAPAPAEPPPTKVRPPVPPAARRSRIPGLGTLRLPATPGSSLRGSLKAARLEIAMGNDTPLARSVQDLLAQLLSRLGRGASPYLLVLSSLREGMERSVAADLLGIGLQRIRGRALLIEIAGSADEPVALHSASRTGRSGVFVDTATGLPTVVLPARDGRRLAAGAVRQIARETGLLIDFILVIGRPLDEPAHDAALADEADLEIVVLGPDDASAKDDPRLDLPGAGAGRGSNRVMLELDTSVGEPGAQTSRPHLVVPSATSTVQA